MSLSGFGNVPTRSIMPPGWNGSTGPSSGRGGASNGGGQATPGQSSPGGAFVWSDSSLTIGPLDTGIHTRVLKDAAVIAFSVGLLFVGLILMAKPDLSQLVSTAVKALPEVAA